MSRDMTATVNLEAESSLLGAMLLSRDAVEIGLTMLVAEDFFGRKHPHLFSAIRTLYRSGDPIDPVTVANQCEQDGTAKIVGDGNAQHAKGQIMLIQAACPASANATGYARLIIEAADRRRLLNLGERLMVAAADPMSELDQTADTAKVELSDLLRPATSLVHPGYGEWAEGIMDAGGMTYDWVMPQVLEHRDRVMLIAGEGFGKSHCLRQWALMAAAGIHWFTEKPVPPMTAMIVDVENSSRQVIRSTQAMHELAGRLCPDYDHNRFTIIPFDELDLNRRADRLRVEAYLSGHRPDLLVIGPLYKLFSSSQRMTWEENAMQARVVIDGWRARYGCAVLIEHHAPKGSGGKRDLDPLGSSVWLRWPEFGLRMDPEGNSGDAKLGHFRGQREIRAWPRMLMRGKPGQWPWRNVDINAEEKF